MAHINVRTLDNIFSTYKLLTINFCLNKYASLEKFNFIVPLTFSNSLPSCKKLCTYIDIVYVPFKLVNFFYKFSNDITKYVEKYLFCIYNSQ